jgi:hypothetical protein
VIRLRRPTDSVDAVRHPLEQTGLDEPRQRAPGDADGTDLLKGDEAPLPFGKVADTREWAWHAAKYNTRVILCSMIVAPAVVAPAGGSRSVTEFARDDHERDLAPPPEPLT